MLPKVLFCMAFPALAALSCTEGRKPLPPPWESGGEGVEKPSGVFSLSEIQAAGELIALTVSGPETYYDYRGRGLGLQYILAEKFAAHIGASLRVEVCRDSAEIVSRLAAGDGDIAAVQFAAVPEGLSGCGVSTDSVHAGWAVAGGNGELATALGGWFEKGMVDAARSEEARMLSAKRVKRRIFSPMLNRPGGVISRYDDIFRRHSSVAGWDWRLLAAMSYQESAFDPLAKSWAGACGLMQIMPSTADHLGVDRADLFDPEANIAAAAKLIRQLGGQFADIADSRERCKFVMAAYNGGAGHVRDAMALAGKHGRDKHRWDHVSEFILKLEDPAYYRDPVVKRGYMRGSETADYVPRILSRWDYYRGSAPAGGTSSTPQKAKKKHRFK